MKTHFGSILVAMVITLITSTQAIASWNWYAEGLNDTVKYNNAYWSRPHNTFENSKFSSLGDALNQGYRAIELDVFPKPGYETIYVSHSYTSPKNNKCSGNKEFVDCLRDIKNWSDNNPGHDVISLQLDMKDFIISPMWNDRAHRLMVANIESVLGSKLYRPKDLQTYTGYSNLRTGVKNMGWPELNQLRGNIIVFGLAGPIGSKNQTQSRMIDTIGSDKMPLFICPEVTAPEHFTYNKYANGFNGSAYSHNNQWVVCGNTGDGKYWATLAAEASRNNQLMAIWSGNDHKFDAYDDMMLAVGWGATMISRETSSTHSGRIPLNGIRNSMPTHFSLQAVNSNKCVDVSGSGQSNGTDIIQWPCTGSANQAFLYSDEKQLRALHNPRYCLDPEGSASTPGWRNVVLWNCGTQKTQKWWMDYRNGGKVKQAHDGYFVLTVEAGSTSNGARIVTWGDDGSSYQNFRLLPVESDFIDWRSY